MDTKLHISMLLIIVSTTQITKQRDLSSMFLPGDECNPKLMWSSSVTDDVVLQRSYGWSNGWSNGWSSGWSSGQCRDEGSHSKDPGQPASLEKICSQIANCKEYDKIKIVEKHHKDLRTRKCMCDEKCSVYGDCCEDSTHYNAIIKENVLFGCKHTPFDGYIYMVDKCPSNSTGNEKIIESCHATNRTLFVHNFLLILPVTVTRVSEKVIYKNAFCALCNYELNFTFWKPELAYKLISEPTPSNKIQYELDPYQSILPYIKVDENHSKLISQVNSSSYSCNIYYNLPDGLASDIRYCQPPSIHTLCSDCEKRTSTNSCTQTEYFDDYYDDIIVLDERNPNLPRIDLCDDVLPANVSNKNVFCPIKNETISRPSNMGCFSENERHKIRIFLKTNAFNTYNNESNNKSCIVETFFSSEDYTFCEDGSVYIKVLDYKFQSNEYTNKTKIPNVIFVCGSEINVSKSHRILYNLSEVLTEILMKVSILFLILYLVTNMNRKKLRSLPNKILFSVCLTLLLFYSVHELGRMNISCGLLAKLHHYLYLSCFTWYLVASVDFWRGIYGSSTKFQTLTGKTRLKRYIFYCFIGWISPLSIISISLFFEWSPDTIVSCRFKPGYGELHQCFIAQYYPKLYFFFYPAATILCIIMVLFAHTSYYIFLSKCKNVKSTTQNNYYMLFMKLALSMGLSWTMLILGECIGVKFFTFLHDILNSSHGILMFFAYGFKKTMLTKMCYLYKNNSVVQRTKTKFSSVTDRIKSTTSQPSTSVDYST